MKRWRCLRCGHEFKATGPQPGCANPRCGISPTEHPRFAGMIIELVTVHYDPPSRVAGIGLNRPACQPHKAIGSGFGGGMASGEPSAVNCEACLATLQPTPVPVIPPEHDETLIPKSREEHEADARAAEIASGQAG